MLLTKRFGRSPPSFILFTICFIRLELKNRSRDTRRLESSRRKAARGLV